MADKKKIAVVLAGCGVYDGSEIHEAVLTMLAIDESGAEYQCFAPDIPQHHVIDHVSGDATGEARNVLRESARIARGDVKDLAQYRAADYQALILPGGFGAAKNLCDFAFNGPDCTVNAVVSKAISETQAAGKPIGALCIAPAILAKLFDGVELTIGSDAETAGALEKMGARHKNTTHGEIVIDEKHRVVTSPCYMLDARISQIATGASNVVKALLRMAS